MQKQNYGTVCNIRFINIVSINICISKIIVSWLYINNVRANSLYMP